MPKDNRPNHLWGEDWGRRLADVLRPAEKSVRLPTLLSKVESGEIDDQTCYELIHAIHALELIMYRKGEDHIRYMQSHDIDQKMWDRRSNWRHLK